MNYKTDSEMFDQAFEYYDQFRPGYPLEMVDALVRCTGLNASSATLEIGAGSGKATELFLKYGFRIHCIDVGENLVKKGKEKFHNEPQVTYECARFENIERLEEKYDTIFAAQSFHWIPQPVGYQKCASLLKDGGYLTTFWNMYLYDDREEHMELIRLSKKYGGFADFVTEEEAKIRIQQRTAEIEKSSYFEKPLVLKFHWEQSYTLEEYYGFVQTGNRFLQLTQQEKENAKKDLQEYFQKFHTMVRPYLTVLYLSKKR